MKDDPVTSVPSRPKLGIESQPPHLNHSSRNIAIKTIFK